MNRGLKFFIIAVLLSILLVFYAILNHEEYLLYASARHAESEMSTDSIITLIKTLPVYQGDSLYITDDGELVSTDPLIQSVIKQMYIVEVNIEGIQAAAVTEAKPVQYVLYRTAINNYIAQYGDKRKTK